MAKKTYMTTKVLNKKEPLNTGMTLPAQTPLQSIHTKSKHTVKAHKIVTDLIGNCNINNCNKPLP